MQENEVKEAVKTALRELKENGMTSFRCDLEVNLKEMARELGEDIYRWQGDEKGEYNLFTFGMVNEKYLYYTIDFIERKDYEDKLLDLIQFADNWFVRY